MEKARISIVAAFTIGTNNCDTFLAKWRRNQKLIEAVVLIIATRLSGKKVVTFLTRKE